MAVLQEAKTESEIKKMTPVALKKTYAALADTYNQIINKNTILCPKCGEFLSKVNFYKSSKYVIGYFPVCKKCLISMAEPSGYTKKESTVRKKYIQDVLQFMDLPYIDSLYESCVDAEKDRKSIGSPFTRMLTVLQSLPKYKGLSWENSEFSMEDEVPEDSIRNQRTIKAGKRRFGFGYEDSDYLFLESEYQDWVTRYECNTKAQEVIFERLSFKKWEIARAQRAGIPTDPLDSTYTKLLSSINVLPKQNANADLTETFTFGQLIDKWEHERPISEPVDEFKDVDGIGKYIRVWFKGALARAFGIDNGYSKEYDDYIAQYTVTKPEYAEDEVTSDEIAERIFGKDGS